LLHNAQPIYEQNPTQEQINMDTNSNPGDLNDAEAPFGQSPSGSGGSSPSASMMFSPLPESSTFPPFSYPGAFQLGTSSPPAELSDLSIDLSPFIEHPANIPEEVTSSAPALRPSHLVENPALPDSPVQPAFLIPRSVDSSPFLDQEPLNSPAQQMPLEDSVDESPFYEHADPRARSILYLFLVLEEEASSASSFHRSEFLDRPANYPEPEPPAFLIPLPILPPFMTICCRLHSSTRDQLFTETKPQLKAGLSASSLTSSTNQSEEVESLASSTGSNPFIGSNRHAYRGRIRFQGVPTPGAFHLANIRETTGENLAFLPRPPNSDRGDADEGSTWMEVVHRPSLPYSSLVLTLNRLKVRIGSMRLVIPTLLSKMSTTSWTASKLSPPALSHQRPLRANYLNAPFAWKYTPTVIPLLRYLAMNRISFIGPASRIGCETTSFVLFAEPVRRPNVIHVK
ncbi:hypothetical protein PSTT_01064, partial [Puccinia striiformis]